MVDKVSTLSLGLRTQHTITDLQHRLAIANDQISSGKRASLFSGLGGQDSRLLLNLQESYRAKSNYVRAVDQSVVRVKAMDAALVSVTDILAEFRAELHTQTPGLVSDSAPLLQQSARAKIEQIIGLLNTQIDGRYVFAGTETATQPLISSATALTAAAAETATLGAPDTGQTVLNDVTANVFGVAANYIAAAVSAAGNRQVSVRVEDGVDVAYGVDVTDQSFADMFGVLYSFATATYAAGIEEEYLQLVSAGLTQLDSAFDDINTIIAQLGVHHQQLGDTKDRHKSDLTIIENQIGDIENVDSFEAVTRFQTLQTQLEASFQTTGILRNLSLSNFI